MAVVKDVAIQSEQTGWVAPADPGNNIRELCAEERRTSKILCRTLKLPIL